MHHACFFIGLTPLKDVVWFVSERWGRVFAQQQDFHWAILLRFYFDFEAGWKLNYANCQRCTPADLESKQTVPTILQNNLNKDTWFHWNNKPQLWLANKNDVISSSHDIWCISTSGEVRFGHFFRGRRTGRSGEGQGATWGCWQCWHANFGVLKSNMASQRHFRNYFHFIFSGFWIWMFFW